MKSETAFRFAREEDLPVILSFIKQLAEYEGMSEQVVATEELLGEWIFRRHRAEVLLAEADGRTAGFALFFHNFSTFLGRAGIYLEDLFVLPELRGRGIGRALLEELARIAVERGCGRLEWWCLDSNTPAVSFYTSMGAKAMDEWTVFRIDGDRLQEI